MNTHFALVITTIIVLTLLSGWGDAQGFIHASKIWKNGKLIPQELTLSAMGFGIGIFLYWVVIKYLNEVGIFSPELQTLGWFGTTIIGIAITTGNFFHWQLIDQIISIGVLSGIGWLFFHTGG